MLKSFLWFSVIWVGVMNVVYYSVYTNFGWSLAILILDNPLLLSPLGCRMLLNMREAGEHGVNEGTTYGLTTISTMGFSQPSNPRSTAISDNDVC